MSTEVDLSDEANQKQNLFPTDSLSRLEVNGRTELDALVKNSSDFQKKRKPTIEKFQMIIRYSSAIPHLYTKYQSRMNHPKAQHYFIDAIRKHLETTNRPDEHAKPRKILSKTENRFK
ncbi:hypothetical protein BJ912DRAFT_1056113 [Pholiota molesta]|nr:hypothetical protein BJ912DRAFT_1056113 [Pholiota molesta]